MGNYSVRVQSNKPIDKMKDKDWVKMEQEGIEGLYKIIKKHVSGHVMSDENAKNTVVEYSIAADAPHIYRDKEDRQNVKLIYT